MRKKRVFRFVTFVSELLDPLTGQNGKVQCRSLLVHFKNFDNWKVKIKNYLSKNVYKKYFN